MTFRRLVYVAEAPVLFVVAALIALMLLSSCATLKGAGGAAVSAAIDCGKPALKDAVNGIAADVSLILDGGALDWQAELDEYKAKGLEVLACAVAKVGIALAQGQKPVMASAVVTASDRAALYLFRRDLHPVNVQR